MNNTFNTEVGILKECTLKYAHLKTTTFFVSSYSLVAWWPTFWCILVFHHSNGMYKEHHKLDKFSSILGHRVLPKIDTFCFHWPTSEQVQIVYKSNLCTPLLINDECQLERHFWCHHRLDIFFRLLFAKYIKSRVMIN